MAPFSMSLPLSWWVDALGLEGREGKEECYGPVGLLSSYYESLRNSDSRAACTSTLLLSRTLLSAFRTICPMPDYNGRYTICFL